MSTRWLGLLAGLLLLAVLPGCKKEGCLGGTDSSCVVPSPCQDLAFQCDSGSVELRQIRPGDAVPGGMDALGAVGDWLIGNDRVVAVIDGVENANLVSPSGGSLIDLSLRGANNDGLNQVFQASGILPADSVRYTSAEVISAGPELAALQFRGTLDGRPKVHVATRYELRPCEPGVRIRTELVNLDPDPNVFILSDVFYYSDRELVPLAPLPGEGFAHHHLDLVKIDESWRAFPYLAAATHAPPHISYSLVSCRRSNLEGVNNELISAAGLPRTIVPPGEFMVYERFLAAGEGKGVAPAVDLAAEARLQLFGETYVTVSGRVLRTNGTPAGGTEQRASVLIYEPGAGDPDDAAGRTPFTQVVPDPDGRFHARLPASGSFTAEVSAYGRPDPARRRFNLAGDDLDLGELIIGNPGHLRVEVRDADTALPVDAMVVVIPADDATREATSGTFYGVFDKCAPWLGPPHGGSPACNRALAETGVTEIDLLPGHFYVYASHGPFATLERQAVVVAGGSAQTLQFALKTLSMLDPGTLSADLHVHGGASFDSSLPDRDRVLSFLAEQVDVIAATDHEVISDYAEAVRNLGAGDRVKVMPGVETTGQIPYLKVPGSSFPKVIGHYNFWPLRRDTSLPRRGGPEDELIEPGELFDRVDPLFSGVGVVEMNHPWAPAVLGRDIGFVHAIGLAVNRPLPDHDDGTAGGMMVRSPRGGHSNLDFQAEEVINGTNVARHLQYRSFWFFFLNQGLRKTGTANSDSHGLTDDTIGIGRNLVQAGFDLAAFDPDALNHAILDGRLVGTNGPLIKASILDRDGNRRGPSHADLVPAPGATVHVEVLAAPWIPVEELRFVVNGAVVSSIGPEGLLHPSDPFSAAGVTRYTGDVPLDSLLPPGQDGWLVVEAGLRYPPFADLDGDGVPDTGDNNGDGIVDGSDVEKGETSGPFNAPADPRDDAHPLVHFARVVENAFPEAFTNPFFIDRAGDGWIPPGIPGTGR